jgi:spore maturation protein CgeB
MKTIQKILFVAPKSISPGRLDCTYWNMFLPLQAIGKTVRFFDTSFKGDKELELEIELFNPDLLFCVMTGDVNYCPHEPWRAIKVAREMGIKTFNWFCDDTWRFEKWSSGVCFDFDACSTPEKSYVPKFEQLGYNNIQHGAWAANFDLYSTFAHIKKTKDVTFIGQAYGDRNEYLNYLESRGIKVNKPSGLSQEDMLYEMSSSRICLNFSKNFNNMKTQMKLRMFEIPAANSLLVTENHVGLEEHYQIDRDVVTFENKEELVQKIKFLFENENYLTIMTKYGHRAAKENDAKIRMTNVLATIQDQVTT